MLKELKNTKWYWFIPLLSLYFGYQMSMWTMNGETYLCKSKRSLITTFNVVFPNIFIFLGLIFTYIK